MKHIVRTLFFIACLFCAFAGSVTVHAADSLDFLNDLLSEDVSEDAADSTGSGGNGTENTEEDDTVMGETAMFGDVISFTIPPDWITEPEAEGIEDCCFAFKGMDENGLEIIFVGMVFDTEDSGSDLYEGGIFEKKIRTYADLADALAEEGMVHLATSYNGIDLILLSDWQAVGGLLLDRNNHLYVFGFMSSAQSMYPVRESYKLKVDIAAILHSMMAVDVNNMMYFDETAPAFEAVSFNGDAEFERMVRAALGKKANAPVYASELAAVRDLAIVEGNMGFVKNIRRNEAYDQPSVLQLENLRLFPNLETLNIDHMRCDEGFEAISELKNLRSLELDRTGIRDVDFLESLSLQHLSLISNDEIMDFTPISSIKSLESVNLAFTGLGSLELLRGLDLRELSVAGNPEIEDLSPIAEMKRLEVLYIGETKVRSLEALRGLQELRILNIQELSEGEEISLEPLQNHTKLEVIYCGGTKVVDTEGLEEVLKN